MRQHKIGKSYLGRSKGTAYIAKVMTRTKVCKACQNSTDDFGIDRSQKDGLNRLCRDCQRTRNHEYYIERYARKLLKAYHEDGGKERLEQKYKNDSLYFKLRRRAYHNKVISRKYHLKETFEAIDFLLVLERFEYKCFRCNKSDGHDLQVDHHMPRCLGYPLTHKNAVLLCETCNGLKNNQHPQQFYTSTNLAILEEIYSVDSHT